jgi:hypothetical protein
MGRRNMTLAFVFVGYMAHAVKAGYKTEWKMPTMLVKMFYLVI